MVAKRSKNKFAAHLRKSERLWRAEAEKEREAWLSRPRLHTGLFEEVWREKEFAERAREIDPSVKIESSQGEDRRQKLDAIRKSLGWSEGRLADFQRLVVEYRRSQDIATYLKIRRTFPEVEIQVAHFAGIDFVFIFEAELKKYGIPGELVAAALDQDEPSVDALCLRLLTLLAEREALPKSGPGHIERRRAAISDTLVNYLISIMLEGYDWHAEAFRIPASLVVLSRRQLSGNKPDLYEAQRAIDKRHTVALFYAKDLDAGKPLSVRGFATRYAIPRSTAARWLASEEFQRDVQAFRALNKLELERPRRPNP